MKKAKESKSLPEGVPLSRLRPWHVAAILAVCTAFFFRDILLQNAFFWEDFIYQYYAFRNFAATSLASGTLPLWNPYTFNGMPFQADIQTALFYVPNLLLTLFVSGGKLYFLWVEVLIIAHVVLAGYGTYLFARELGLEPAYALVSAFAFAFSGFMIMQVIHQTFICQVAWTPLILLGLRRTLYRKSVFWMGLTALLLGHAILAGSPQFTLYIMLLLFAYFLFELAPFLRRERVKDAAAMIALAGGAVVLALGLTSVQILPTMELANLSQRAEISFAKSSEGSLYYQQIVTLIAPKYFGASGAQESGFWLGGVYWSYWETCIYLGLVPLIAVVAALTLLKRNRTVAFFFGILVFGFLYSLGDHFFLHGLFFNFVPGFDKFRVPGRMSFFFTFGSSILAGFGFRRIVELARTNPKLLRSLLAGVAGAAVLIWIFAFAGIFQPTGNAAAFAQVHDPTVAEALRAMVFTLLVCGVIFLAARGVISAAALVISALVIHQIDMNIFGFNQNNGKINPEEYYGRTGELVNFLKEDGKKEYFRVNARQGGAMILDRNQGMVDRIFMCEGYTPLALQRVYPPGLQVYDLLNAKYRIKVDTANQTMGMQPSSTYLPRAWMAGRVRVLPKEADEKSYMESADFHPAQEVLLEDEPAGASAIEGKPVSATVGITSYTLNEIRMVVSGSGNGMLVVSEIFYPGWHAYVDGVEAPIYRADWCLRAVPVPAGDHHIDMRFEPASFRHGLIGTGVSAVVVLLLVVVPAVRQNKSSGPVSQNKT